MDISLNSNYDLIASLYDYDMALNMPYDDIQFYLNRFSGSHKVLEIGCGTGRITLPLHKVCAEIIAIDSSLPMLQQLNKKLIALPATTNTISIAAMDAKSLALSNKFDRIFFAFSGINYLSNPEDVKKLLLTLKNNLADGGSILLDAFVPKNIIEITDWQVDYRRTLPDGRILQRAKKITKQKLGNLVQRRYEVFSHTNDLLDIINTSSIIYPYSPQELQTLLSICGYQVVAEWWDYREEIIDPVCTDTTSKTQTHKKNAQFFTVEAIPLNKI